MTVRLNEIIERAKDKYVAKLIVCAVNKLFERDRFLFEVDANERSITHRFGIYLQENFSDWDVDCEYNRNGDKVKYLFERIGERARTDDTEGRTVFPDIIVHKRKTNINKLIVEVKKRNNTQSKEIDIEKLKSLSKQLNYENALFLRFKTGADGIGIEEFCWVNSNQMDDKNCT